MYIQKDAESGSSTGPNIGLGLLSMFVILVFVAGIVIAIAGLLSNKKPRKK